MSNKRGNCDSCSENHLLTQVGKFKYCKRCLNAHEKEKGVNEKLRKLLSTHSYAANRTDVVSMFHQGATLEEVKKYLDTNKDSELEAEV